MAPDQDIDDGDAALRAMLVARVRDSVQQPASLAAALRPGGPGRPRTALTATLATVVVLALVVVLSAVAIRLGDGGRLPAQGGGSLPSLSTPSGVLLGRYSSKDGPNQTHTIHPNGMALSVSYTCTGRGAYFFGISHDSDESGTGACGGGSGYGNKGHTGPLTVTIRTAKTMRWEFVVVGIPETYVTPQPVLTPRTPTGAVVPFCSPEQLSAVFDAKVPVNSVPVSYIQQIALTNTGKNGCALAGYPSLRFLTPDGAPTGQASRMRSDERGATEKGLKPVLLPAGGHAYVQLDYYSLKLAGPSCHPVKATGIQVDLRNRLAGAEQKGVVTVKAPPIEACSNPKTMQLFASVFVDYSLKK